MSRRPWRVNPYFHISTILEARRDWGARGIFGNQDSALFLITSFVSTKLLLNFDALSRQGNIPSFNGVSKGKVLSRRKRIR